MKRTTTRRQFLKQGAIGGVGLWIARNASAARTYSANEKLAIAGIGVGGRGAGDIDGVSTEAIVALCDVDQERASKTFARFPEARRYWDFRQMLEEEGERIDAVVVATPDHVHASASIMAMTMGKHVYCEKPLTHNVQEARWMRETAARYRVATQMGNQATASDSLRQAVEVIRSGAIGPVREVHSWTDRPTRWWPQGAEAILRHAGVQRALHGGGAATSAPRTIAWDLWLGPATERPYDRIYHPFSWRGWWDFGTGALGDMACHIMNMPYMALELGAPTSVEAECSEVNPETAPLWSVIRYEFPARGDKPPVTYTWHDGGKHPPAELFHGHPMDPNGSLLVGEKGSLYVPDTGGVGWVLLPQKSFEGYEPPAPTLPRTSGHHAEWVAACKGGQRALSNFDYAGPLTETVLLGNVAIRAGHRIEWDAEKLKVTNEAEANRLLRREYRDGWAL